MPKQRFKCAATGKTIEASRLPPTWKVIQGATYSPEAIKQKYRVGCVSIPIVFSDDAEENKRINDTLNQGFRLSTGLANWFMREFYVRDIRRTPDSPEKMPTFDVGSLYQDVKETFPLATTPSGLLASMEHRIRGIYKHARYSILWTCAQSLPSFRYPYPYPVRAQDWTLVADAENRDQFTANVNIAKVRYLFKLSTSYKYKRQRQGLHCLLDLGRVGEVCFVRKKGGKVFAQISGYFPKESHQEFTGEFSVRSDSQSLLVALDIKGKKLWIYNGDQARRWVQENRRRLNRWADDSKYEDRPRPGFTDRRKASSRKFHNRMDTLVDQLAARVVNFAKRRRYAQINLDLTCHDFVDSFPWRSLRDRICQQAAAASISVVEPEPEDNDGKKKKKKPTKPRKKKKS